jgi:DNA invertase Pin-like site-specific DNA recombinase
MTYCIYCRVSTDQQELEQQIESCRKYCEYKGFEIGEIYTDIGSGKDTIKRPNYLKMVKDLRAFKYQGIIVFRFDRLGRNAHEVVSFFDEMETKGIQIHSLNENLDTTSAIGRAVRDIIIRLSQLEREQISEATKQRLGALKNLGKKLGRPNLAVDLAELTKMRAEGLSFREMADKYRYSAKNDDGKDVYKKLSHVQIRRLLQYRGTLKPT